MRCFGDQSPLYAKYHDQEWGVPSFDDRYLFEMLILEGAQAGLSFELILRKRQGYQQVFYGFDPVKVAQMKDQELEDLRHVKKIIPNRLKIRSVRTNALVFLKIQEEFGSFSNYIWAYVDSSPLRTKWKTLQEVPCETPLSQRISKDLKKRGMTFVGPKIIYSFLQAVGIVNDHLASCHCS